MAEPIPASPSLRDALEVTQADRDAAADAFPAVHEVMREMIREGCYDDSAPVQAFARHRIAASAKPLGESGATATPDQGYAMGWCAAVEAAAQVAIKWRDENKAAAAKARTREGRLAGAGLDHPGMAEMLDGAAIECNAIAGAIRELPLPLATPATPYREAVARAAEYLRRLDEGGWGDGDIADAKYCASAIEALSLGLRPIIEDPEAKARELLANEYDRIGYHAPAARVRQGGGDDIDAAALRAIIASLSLSKGETKPVAQYPGPSSIGDEE